MIALQRYAPSCCGPRSYGDIIHGAVARSKGGPKTVRIRSSRGRPLLLLGTVDGHADAVDAQAIHGEHGERHLGAAIFQHRHVALLGNAVEQRQQKAAGGFHVVGRLGLEAE